MHLGNAVADCQSETQAFTLAVELHAGVAELFIEALFAQAVDAHFERIGVDALADAIELLQEPLPADRALTGLDQTPDYAPNAPGNGV